MPSTRDLMNAISDGNLDRVQEILTDRDHQGIPRVDINNGFGNAGTALLWALWCNPINELIVQTLLDVRDNANNPISNINHQGPPNPAMIQTIRQLGGLGARNVPAHVRRAQEERPQQQHLQPEIVVRQERRAPEQLLNGNQHQEQQRDTTNQEAQRFINNTQNTHQPEVTVSVAASIKRLKTRYPEINILLQEIRIFLIQLPDSNTKKQYAINCLDRIERDPTEHALSGRTKLTQALALIWKGIHDTSSLVEGLEELTNQDIELRKSTLVDNLYRAQTEYGTCFVGTLNKIIETLDRAHPDVTIVTGQSNILPTATERARIIVRDELKNKSPREQRQILKSWDDPDPDNGETVATTFRKVMVESANSKLEEEFQQLLTKQKREEITGQFEYLPRPILHEKLDKLIKTINELPDDSDNPSRQAAILRLKEQANHAYDESDRTFQEEYELLSTSYNGFSTLDQYVKRILSLDEGDNPSRQAAILRLKEQANHAYDGNLETFSERKIGLKKNLEAFNQFDLFAKKMLTVKEKYQGTSEKRLKSINGIELFVNSCYRSYAAGTTAGNCEEILTNEISGIRDYVKHDHKQHGALRFFGRLQPSSRLVTDIDETFTPKFKL